MGIKPQTDQRVQIIQLALALAGLTPTDFAWTRSERKKLELMAEQLNCTEEVARRMLVFFLLFISSYRKELAVADLPQILSSFPIKWGYKKKRHDFLKLLQDMDFLFVQTNYWAKVRAKKYGIAKSGQDLLERLLSGIFLGTAKSTRSSQL